MSDNRLKKGDSVPYAQIANEILYHPDLSLKAKGLYACMYAKPDEWNFTSLSMAKQLKDYKSSSKSKTQKLNLTKEEYEFKTKVELDVYIDSSRLLYTNIHSSKQLVSSTLTEIWKQLYIINEAKNNADPQRLAKVFAQLKGN